MEERNAVSVKDLGVKFHLSEQKVDDLKDYLIYLKVLMKNVVILKLLQIGFYQIFLSVTRFN